MHSNKVSADLVLDNWPQRSRILKNFYPMVVNLEGEVAIYDILKNGEYANVR